MQQQQQQHPGTLNRRRQEMRNLPSQLATPFTIIACWTEPL